MLLLVEMILRMKLTSLAEYTLARSRRARYEEALRLLYWGNYQTRQRESCCTPALPEIPKVDGLKFCNRSVG